MSHWPFSSSLASSPICSSSSGSVPQRLIGMIALTDLLKARTLNLDAEQRRERVLGAHIQLPFGEKRRKTPHA